MEKPIEFPAQVHALARQKGYDGNLVLSDSHIRASFLCPGPLPGTELGFLGTPGSVGVLKAEYCTLSPFLEHVHVQARIFSLPEACGAHAGEVAALMTPISQMVKWRPSHSLQMTRSAVPVGSPCTAPEA